MRKIIISKKLSFTRAEKEIYRALRMNLEFTGVENRALVVTSTILNEGKSTVSLNLAYTLASEGKRTVYIDADMRKSVFNGKFGLSKDSVGLSHFLSGQYGINDIIWMTDQEKLMIIPAGKFPKNPTELLTNGRFMKLIKALKEAVDYVIIDAPPLGNVIDAAAIAQVCDGSIIVVSANTCSKAEVRKSAEQLRAANDNIVGVVLNKADNKRSGYYGRSYQYGYGDYY